MIFQNGLKESIGKVVTDKINTFYKPQSAKMEDIIFDTIVNTQGELTKTKLEQELERYNPAKTTNIEQIKWYTERYKLILKVKNQKYFCISTYCYNGCGNGDTYKMLYIFKNVILVGYKYRQDFNINDYIPHSIPLHLLLVLKLVNTKYITNNPPDITIDSLIKVSTEHPEYFQPNSVEFETICQREHAEIKKQKEELEELTHQSNEIMEEAHRIIDENVEKKEYYESLDRRLQQIVLDEEKIREEKQKMLFVKERLLEMKAEIEKERQELEKEKQKFISQKNKSIDIDKCFEDLL